MVEKMRIGIALQPVATALFANSPFRDGSDTGKAPCQAPVNSNSSNASNCLWVYNHTGVPSLCSVPAAV